LPPKSTQPFHTASSPTGSADPSAQAAGDLFADEKRMLGLLYANTREYFLLIDRNLTIQMFNQVTYRQIKTLLGISIERGLSVLALAPVARHPDLTTLYEGVFAGRVHDTVVTLKTPDGNDFCVRNVFSPARDESGAVIGVMVTSQDITEQRRQEKELTENEERLRFALEGSNLGLWDWNLQTDEMYFSASYKKLYGFSEDEIANKKEEWSSRIHPDDRTYVHKAVEVHTGGPHPYYETTYRLQDKSGKYRWILSRGMLFSWDEDGQPLRMIGTHTDISDQKTAEEALRQSNERFQLAAKATYEALWEWDIVSDTIYHSPVYQEMFGYDFNKPGNTIDWPSVIHPEDRDKTVTGYQAALDNPALERWEQEYRYRKADGSYCAVSDHCLILRDANGKPTKVIGAVQDISRRKEAEEDARANYELFRLATKATSDAIYDWDQITNIISWSDALLTLFGHQPEETTIDVWESLLHPDDRVSIVDDLHNALSNPKTNHWKQEYRFRKADGSYSAVLERGFIVRDEEGRALRMIGAVQDITDLKEKEAQLLKSNERFLLAAKATSDAIWDWDITSGELVWGEGLSKLFGYSPVEMPINTWETLIHETEREAIQQSLTSAIEHKKRKHWRGEYRFRHHDGSYRYVFDRGFIVRDEDGNATRMIGAIQDITDRMEKEQQLLESNERFDIVMRATNDLIWDWNLETGAFYRDPEGVRKVYGVNDEASIASMATWIQRVHPDDHAQLQTAIQAILHASSADKSFEAEYRFRKDDGDYVYIYDRGILVCTPDGKPVRLIGAAQDITERKMLEQELLARELNKQKLISQSTIETQERERGEIGKELHDNVNQILTTTKLYLDLSMTNPELKDDLIRKSSKNVIYVINEIRQLSRSLMNPSLGDLGLSDAIADLIENINLTRKLQVEFKVSDKVEALLSEPQKLTVFRIIQEALNNAIRHSQASRALIALVRKADNVALTITDNGVGFEQASIKKGAGLNNIQNRVYLASGNLVVQTTPGNGCTLSITFPIKSQGN
jgi:PAS domain S-box-containing protein